MHGQGRQRCELESGAGVDSEQCIGHPRAAADRDGRSGHCANHVITLTVTRARGSSSITNQAPRSRGLMVRRYQDLRPPPPLISSSLRPIPVDLSRSSAVLPPRPLPCPPVDDWSALLDCCPPEAWPPFWPGLFMFSLSSAHSPPRLVPCPPPAMRSLSRDACPPEA
ncbi:hypothetical protein D3C84_927580 [compost metagenome]